MKKTIVFAACATLLAAPCFSEVVVTSVWKRVAHVVVNDVCGGTISVQGSQIGLTGWGYYGPGWTTYWHSTNDAVTWRSGVNFDTVWYRTWFAFQRGSFFLDRDGNPFGVSKQGYLYWSTNAGVTWKTNFYIPADHAITYAVAALDPDTTNLHMFYVATNCPPLDPTPSINIRYAVYTKSTAVPGWDLPATNMILGDWPSVTNMFRGAYAFRDPVTGRFRSVRTYSPAANDTLITEDPWLCVVTNNGGQVMNMNTPIPMDGVNPYVAVGPDGTIYMAHVSNEISNRRGTNLVFTEFRYDEGAGLSFVTNQVIASGPVIAPDYHYVSMPCIGLGVNGEVIVAYQAGGNGNLLNDVRIIARDRFGIWQAPVTVASGDSDTPGIQFPGSGVTSRVYGGIFQTSGIVGGLDMAVVWQGELNYVYLYYGEYSGALSASWGAQTKNGVVHKLIVYHPPPPKGTIVTFK